MHTAIEIAERLAEDFRARAAEYDRTAEFPAENYRRMRAEGYLAATVPEELGGLGAGIAVMAQAQQALARGCASTALAVNMHLFQVGTIADAWRGGNAAVEPLLRRVAGDGIVIGSIGAEALVAGEWTPSTTAERRNGNFVVNGRKFFCSQAPGADVFRFLARDSETGETLVMMAPGSTAGIRIAETWDTTGMRATASHDLVLEDVVVPEAAVGARFPVGAPSETAVFANIGRWFLPLMTSVYIGIAEEAREEAYRALGTGINSSHRHDVLTHVLIGEMEAALLAASSVRDQVAADLTAAPADPQQAFARALLMKDVVVAQAERAVDKAVEIAGGRSYYRKSPLERLVRDMRAARFHPPSAPVSYQMAGERLLAARRAPAPA